MTDTLKQALEALTEAQKHHRTTSMPRAIERYGSVEACEVAGRKVWFELVPAAIASLQASLAVPQRQRFEAWADDQGFPLKRLETSDGYLDLRTHGAWDAWQAALAAPPDTTGRDAGAVPDNHTFQRGALTAWNILQSKLPIDPAPREAVRAALSAALPEILAAINRHASPASSVGGVGSELGDGAERRVEAAIEKLRQCKLGCGPFGQCKAAMHGVPSECAAPASPAPAGPSEPVAHCNLELWATGKYHADDCFSEHPFTGSSPVFAAPSVVQGDGQAVPIPMILHCPKCHMQHIDKSNEDEIRIEAAERGIDREGAREYERWLEDHEWTNPPHRSHLCHACGCIWRPADVPTTGVAEIKTRGKDDNWFPETPHA